MFKSGRVDKLAPPVLPLNFKLQYNIRFSFRTYGHVFDFRAYGFFDKLYILYRLFRQILFIATAAYVFFPAFKRFKYRFIRFEILREWEVGNFFTVQLVSDANVYLVEIA